LDVGIQYLSPSRRDLEEVYSGPRVDLNAEAEPFPADAEPALKVASGAVV
jgi:hypothetical protein